MRRLIYECDRCHQKVHDPRHLYEFSVENSFDEGYFNEYLDLCEECTEKLFEGFLGLRFHFMKEGESNDGE